MKSGRRGFLGTVLVLLAAACWGIIGLFVRRLSGAGLGVWEISLTRMGVGLLAIGVYLGLFHRDRLRIRLRDLWCFAGAGILSLMCMNFCYNQAVQVTSLAIAGTLLYTAPTFVMLMSLVFFREPMTKTKLLALVLAFAGCALVSGIARGHLALTPRALLLGLGSGLSYALYSIFSRFALDRGYDSWTITFYSFAVCVLGCLCFSHPGQIVSAAAAQPALLIPMLLLGLITGFAAFVLYTAGLRHLEAGRASVIASFELVFGAIVGLIAYGERIGLDALAGIVLILIAVGVLSVGAKK